MHDPLRYSLASHGAYMGTRDLPWVTTDFVLEERCTKTRRRARDLYADFVRKGIEAGFDPTILIAHKRDRACLATIVPRNVVRRPPLKPSKLLIKRSPAMKSSMTRQRFGVQRIALLSPSRIRALARVRVG